MRPCSPAVNAPCQWKYVLTPNGEFHGDLLIPCKDLGLSNTTDSFPLETHFFKPANLSSSEPYINIRNNLFLPHPYEPEYPVPQTQTLPQSHVPSEDLAYNTNEHEVQRHLELLEDVVAGNFDSSMGTNSIQATGTAQPGLESHHHDLNMSDNENSRMDELLGVTKGCLVGKMNMEHCQTSIEEQLIDTNHSASGTEVSNKPRIRWTQELHECFMRAITDLGGADKATPKNIMIKMGIEGLTICHIKSHLQKYRLARHQEQAKEDKGASCSEERKKTTTDKENSNLKLAMHNSEVLRMQWDLQKSLHDQLEFQKELQLRAEENAHQLQKLLEEQKIVGQAFVLVRQSLSPTCSGTSSPPSATAGTKTGAIARKGEKLQESCEGGHSLSELDIGVSSTSKKRGRLDNEETIVKSSVTSSSHD